MTKKQLRELLEIGKETRKIEFKRSHEWGVDKIILFGKLAHMVPLKHIVAPSPPSARKNLLTFSIVASTPISQGLNL